MEISYTTIQETTIGLTYIQNNIPLCSKLSPLLKTLRPFLMMFPVIWLILIWRGGAKVVL